MKLTKVVMPHFLTITLVVFTEADFSLYTEMGIPFSAAINS